MTDLLNSVDYEITRHNTAQAAFEAQYNEVEKDVLDKMKGFAEKFDTMTDIGGKFLENGLYHDQGELLAALASDDDVTVLKIMHRAFRNEVEAIIKHRIIFKIKG
jgi:hypothetical protein